MGRNASGENKTEYVKIRVKPTLKEDIQSFRVMSKYQDIQEQDFLSILVRTGLEVEKVEASWHQEAITAIVREREPIRKSR
jgi:hypothetical protein